ncbi:hypothetical protein BHE74_00019682 [Ensete ventricosum]|nr:hypothetical protein GW17_00014251 [Ensete ventricosum]RWW72488.1 hypothetical protein BHE74_00019682 [Ensete ventricosum]RZR90534.1 hypothetical protein BHM03_00018440 [Ensete ventricosum]
MKIRVDRQADVIVVIVRIRGGGGPAHLHRDERSPAERAGALVVLHPPLAQAHRAAVVGLRQFFLLHHRKRPCDGQRRRRRLQRLVPYAAVANAAGVVGPGVV